jgi:hypothetical protein
MLNKYKENPSGILQYPSYTPPIRVGFDGALNKAGLLTYGRTDCSFPCIKAQWIYTII